MIDSDIVGKIDVVKRQLIESIRLFYDRRDNVVIHTIVASAHQILIDLGKSQGVPTVVKSTADLKGKEVQKFLRGINYPYNFFKHADNDPAHKIDIGPLQRLTQDFILDAILMLYKISKNIPFECKVYWYWFVSYYPEGFENLPKDGEVAKMQELELGEWSFNKISSFIKYNETDNIKT